MPKKAIFLAYVCDQNEPSKPFSQVFVLPDDEAERDEALRDFYAESVVGDREDNIPITAEHSHYGDLTVGEDPYLFVTFLDEDEPECELSAD